MHLRHEMRPRTEVPRLHQYPVSGVLELPGHPHRPRLVRPRVRHEEIDVTRSRAPVTHLTRIAPQPRQQNTSTPASTRTATAPAADPGGSALERHNSAAALASPYFVGATFGFDVISTFYVERTPFLVARMVVRFGAALAGPTLGGRPRPPELPPWLAHPAASRRRTARRRAGHRGRRHDPPDQSPADGGARTAGAFAAAAEKDALDD
jgi:hypothetical protein